MSCPVSDDFKAMVVKTRGGEVGVQKVVDRGPCGCKMLIVRISCIHAAQHHSEGKIMVVCRVPKDDEISLSTALDAGCAGIIIPHVESAEEVRGFMKRMYFGG